MIASKLWLLNSPEELKVTQYEPYADDVEYVDGIAYAWQEYVVIPIGDLTSE